MRQRSGRKVRPPQREPWARARPRPTHSQLPHDCVVLAVDTAQVSGWCLMIRGLYVSSLQFDVLKHPTLLEEVCRNGLELGRVNGLPVVLVYEKPFFGTGQGQYIGAWKAAWVAAGGVKTRFVGVYPAQWRARVLGSHYASAERATVRPVERRVAAQIAHRECGADEAPAVCIARWGSHAGDVYKKLPEAKRKGAA
ncbi:MAG TPA: hypothetical protein VFZ61_03760 [Polyangiales bacterium]